MTKNTTNEEVGVISTTLNIILMVGLFGFGWIMAGPVVAMIGCTLGLLFHLAYVHS